MKEIQSIISKFDDYKAKGLKMALATVVNVEESSYRRSGARMLITEDGNWIGGISGGCLEGDTLKKAQYAILQQKSTKVTYDTRDGDPNQIGVGLGCNGLIDVLITPIPQNQDQIISVLREIVERRHPSILVTDLQTGHVVDCTYSINGLACIKAEIENVKLHQRSLMTQNDGGHFIECIPPTLSLYIFGKNYDVIPLAKLAKEIGWNVNVIANPIKTSKHIHEISHRIISDKDELPVLDPYSIALLMSHDYATDKRNLQLLQPRNLPYIGILGPKKRSKQLIAELKGEKVQITESNIYAPMGLDTGATTPEEIAISILAEVRSVFSSRFGSHLRDRKGSIHIN